MMVVGVGNWKENNFFFGRKSLSFRLYIDVKMKVHLNNRM